MAFPVFDVNWAVVTRLRDRGGGGAFPEGVPPAGPAGSGKYTLALMLAKSMNCLAPRHTDELPDFCGKCANCIRIAQSEDLAAHCSEAVDAREARRETDKKETRIFGQTPPDVLIIPPYPPQMIFKVDQGGA